MTAHLKLITAAALLGLSSAWAAPGAHGPNGEHLDAPGTAVNASGLARLPDGSVNVPKLAQRRMAIRTLLAPESEAAATVELPGRVVMDPNASGRVQAVHGGRIEPGPKGLPVAGQAVRRGEVLAWAPCKPQDLTAADFEAVLALKPELVIFGSGPRLQFVPPALMRALIDLRIGVETMDTPAACRTYNVLVSEGRSAVAALLLDPPVATTFSAQDKG
jgi:hypothetical protein